jgi:hypothetical protein
MIPNRPASSNACQHDSWATIASMDDSCSIQSMQQLDYREYIFGFSVCLVMYVSISWTTGQNKLKFWDKIQIPSTIMIKLERKCSPQLIFAGPDIKVLSCKCFSALSKLDHKFGTLTTAFGGNVIVIVDGICILAHSWQAIYTENVLSSLVPLNITVEVVQSECVCDYRFIIYKWVCMWLDSSWVPGSLHKSGCVCDHIHHVEVDQPDSSGCVHDHAASCTYVTMYKVSM